MERKVEVESRFVLHCAAEADDDEQMSREQLLAEFDYRRGYWQAICQVIDALKTGLLPRQLGQFESVLRKWAYDKKDYENCTPPPRFPEPWKKVSKRVLERDRNVCHYCGGYANTVDHIVAIANGGTDDESNLVACCKPCNSQKATKEYFEFMAKEHIVTEQYTPTALMNYVRYLESAVSEMQLLHAAPNKRVGDDKSA